MDKIRIMIVDDHDLLRQGLSSMLKTEPGVEVVGSYGSADEVLDHHHEIRADIILMDIKIPKMNGFDLYASLKAQNPDYKIIFLSMEINHAYIKRAISLKAEGYLPKNSNIDVVLDAIQAVFKGEKYYDANIKDYIFHLMLDDFDLNNDPLLEKLTEREVHVLRMLVDGKQNKDIANLLFISTKTVESHRNNILKKLDIGSTADLVKFAIAKGITANPYLD
ncbi:response regulator transcription factor [Reichenbachiella sp.]|uniref:response regulator transcription factor n=1 Tax=Reichenbachiella sp. TaxID=2184521 RepID=UPI0032973192